MSSTNLLPPPVHPTEPLYLLNGTSSSNSYAAVARRGNVFLGLKFCALVGGEPFGAPDKSYLFIRLRSVRNPAVAKKIDQKEKPSSVVSFPGPDQPLDQAWPNIKFEKIDEERASGSLGLFIDGSLEKSVPEVIKRIEEARLFQKLVDAVLTQAGPEHRILHPKVAAAWLARGAMPLFKQMTQAVNHETIAALVLKDFAQNFSCEVETIGSHLQVLKHLFKKHAVSICAELETYSILCN